MMQHRRGTLALGLALAVTPSGAFVLPPQAPRLSSARSYTSSPVAATLPKKANANAVQGRRKPVAPLQNSWLGTVTDFFTGERA